MLQNDKICISLKVTRYSITNELIAMCRKKEGKNCWKYIYSKKENTQHFATNSITHTQNKKETDNQTKLPYWWNCSKCFPFEMYGLVCPLSVHYWYRIKKRALELSFSLVCSIVEKNDSVMRSMDSNRWNVHLIHPSIIATGSSELCIDTISIVISTIPAFYMFHNCIFLHFFIRFFIPIERDALKWVRHRDRKHTFCAIHIPFQIQKLNTVKRRTHLFDHSDRYTLYSNCLFFFVVQLVVRKRRKTTKQNRFYLDQVFCPNGLFTKIYVYLWQSFSLNFLFIRCKLKCYRKRERTIESTKRQRKLQLFIVIRIRCVVPIVLDLNHLFT